MLCLLHKGLPRNENQNFKYLLRQKTCIQTLSAWHRPALNETCPESLGPWVTEKQTPKGQYSINYNRAAERQRYPTSYTVMIIMGDFNKANNVLQTFFQHIEEREDRSLDHCFTQHKYAYKHTSHFLSLHYCTYYQSISQSNKII